MDEAVGAFYVVKTGDLGVKHAELVKALEVAEQATREDHRSRVVMRARYYVSPTILTEVVR